MGSSVNDSEPAFLQDDFDDAAADEMFIQINEEPSEPKTLAVPM